MTDTSILQFGTSRFLQAHAALFVSQAMERGEALGPITVVQTTANPQSTARVAALSGGAGYPVRIRGLRDGARIDTEVRGRAIVQALQADADWRRVRELACGPVEVIVSNTGDRGYELDADDGPGLLDATDRAPRSFIAKLLVLLHARWQRDPARPLTILPCELIARNGDTLRGLVMDLARAWGLPPAFIDSLGQQCVWANSLVDRIVSQAIEPVGAVTEPYALWAIERQPGLTLPCQHEAIVLTDDLDHHERLKLLLLNLAHTMLAERWIVDGRPEGRTVLEAMQSPPLRELVEATWREEVIPLFRAEGLEGVALDYLDSVRDRLLNPFLEHRLADIAGNHSQKKQRRLAPAVAWAQRLVPDLPQPQLRAALASGLG